MPVGVARTALGAGTDNGQRPRRIGGPSRGGYEPVRDPAREDGGSSVVDDFIRTAGGDDMPADRAGVDEPAELTSGVVQLNIGGGV